MIDTLQQKKRHPIASRIPRLIWIKNFYGVLNSEPLPEIDLLGKTIRTDNLPRDKKQALIVALICFPAVAPEEIIQFAQNHLKLTNQNIFSLVTAMERLDLLKCLKDQNQNAFPGYIRANKYQFMLTLAEHGCLDILQWLETWMPPDEFKAMLGSHKPFIRAAENGHLHLLKWLNERAGEHSLALRAEGYAAYCYAAQNGHTDIMEWITASLSPEEITELLQTKGFDILSGAANNGHVNTLILLRDSLKSQLFLEMIRQDGYAVFRLACQNERLEVLKWLKENILSEFLAMITTNDYGAFRYAFSEDNREVLKWLIMNSAVCFSYLEMHGHEYGALMVPLMDDMIRELNHEREHFRLTRPNAVFDIQDEERVKVMLFVIRNLIRQNNSAHNEILNFLIEIPSIRARLHETLTDQPNELVHLALTTGNTHAARILLSVDAVRRIAAQNNFYRIEATHGIDYRTLTRDHESSMRSLSEGEQKRLEKAINYYQPTIDARGADSIIDELKTTLATIYVNSPAQIEVDGQTITLPLYFNELTQLNLKPGDYQNALKAYYQHKAHTVLRYLSIPNHWIHPDASYVCTDPSNRRLKYADFQGYKPVIAMYYLAVVDKSIPPAAGHTYEGKMEHFINELALIGRAHNWDKTRIRNGKEEEFDDLGGDRPSCYSGVKKRLFQSVIGHPFFVVLNLNTLIEEIKEFARNHFTVQITTENKAVAFDAFNYYVTMLDLEAEHAEQLKIFNIPREKQNVFIDMLKQKYGTAFTGDPGFISYVEEVLSLKPNSPSPLDSYHALKLDGITGLYQMLEKVNQSEVNESSATTAENGLFLSGHKRTRDALDNLPEDDVQEEWGFRNS